MTGPEHYAVAERLLAELPEWRPETSTYANIVASAQVHATLALAAATAEPFVQRWAGDEDVLLQREWTAAIS